MRQRLLFSTKIELLAHFSVYYTMNYVAVSGKILTEYYDP